MKDEINGYVDMFKSELPLLKKHTKNIKNDGLLKYARDEIQKMYQEFEDLLSYIAIRNRKGD